MEITTDVYLRGTIWDQTIQKLKPIFETRTHYSLYMLCLAIGITYDKRIENPDGDDEFKTVPRNIFSNHDNGKLDTIFQAAILMTKTVNFSEEKRLHLAFYDESNLQDEDKLHMKKIDFLTQFANFGVTKLFELISSTPVETMENLKNLIINTIEDKNSEVSYLSDEILLEDD